MCDFAQKTLKKNQMKKAGIIILIIGVLLTIVTTVTYFTREKVVDLGGIEINANKRHHVSWSPLVGVAVMAVGGVLFFVPFKK
jgi:divalent metal cation (Fe/Co/Zn/Cd) transporter